MKISEKWLREWSNPALDGKQLIEQLTMAGLEVDAYQPVAPAFENIVVGFIQSTEPHPDAKKLTICQVLINDDKKIVSQIVCAATNARSNIKVVVALPGATLPDGLTIATRELRGVRSEGMLCAADEIGLSEEESHGIMELAADAPIGQSIREYLALDDHIIEVDLTPNRGDCLSVLGLAREVTALNAMKVPKPKIKETHPTISDTKKVMITANEGCPRYVGRVIRNINQKATTPIWMQERLRRSGIRSVSVVVDVTNYVLLELGQPMHAFDLAKLSGDIVVRWARANEKLTLLDGKEVTLKEDVLAITDDSGVIAMAGIMGGLSTAINNETRDIFLESAFFTPLSIAGRARRYGLHTDSSQRFERGVDPTIQNSAIERATGLIVEIAGGEVGPIIEVINPHDAHFHAKTVQLNKNRVNKVLGINLSGKDIVDMLHNLGIVFESETDRYWKFTIPSYRFDIAIQEDLIEEVARIHGYSNIEAAAPTTALRMISHETVNNPLVLLRNVLVDNGYLEAITYSFVDPQWHDLFSPSADQMTLLNPISQDMSVMRYSLLPGLLQALKFNIARQQSRVRFFESGLGFIGKAEKLKQINLLAGVVCGELMPLQWSANKEVDFFDVKNSVEQLFLALGISKNIKYLPARNPIFHPGQSAEIYLEDELVGYVGMAHPGFLQRADIKQNIGMFELYLDRIQPAKVPKCKEISSFPSIRRDIAVLVSRDISVASLCRAIEKIDSELLQKVIVFDIYEGKGISETDKSVALALFLQHVQRTLTDEEVNEFMSKVLSTLQTEFQARLRD